MEKQSTGEVIRALRREKGLTQAQLGDMLHVSDRTVSKWERGAGLPDAGTLAALSGALGVRTEDMLLGTLPENDINGGNMKNTAFFVCPVCGNIITAAGKASVACCGRTLGALAARKADSGHAPVIEEIDGERCVSFEHAMGKDHYIAFIAMLTGDVQTICRQYPEWSAQARFPKRGHGKLIWFCSRDGLFEKNI